MKFRLVLGTALVLAVAGGAYAYWRLHDPARACTAALGERRFAEAAEACARAFERSHEGEHAAAASAKG